MRIAHVTATFPPYAGGTGNVCYYNARELARRGHTVSVFTAAWPGTPPHESIGGVSVRRLRPLVQIGNAPVIPGLSRALRGFDLIHLHYPFILGAEMVRVASSMYRTPMVMSFHNDLTGVGPRGPVFALYQRISALLTVREASRVCAVSLDHYYSSALSRLSASRYQTVVEVPNGVDAGRFCPSGPVVDLHKAYGVHPHAKLVLFAAALDRAHHFKGLGRLLQALVHLPGDVWLLIIGDGEQRLEYQREAQRLGVANRTVFAGGFDHEDMPRFFRSADVTVLPSSPPESFGLVLIESLACGTPVIGSRIPGVRKVVNHGIDGLLVESADPVALAGAIQQVVRDEATRRDMGRKGRDKVEQYYTWETVGDRLEEIYHQVLG